MTLIKIPNGLPVSTKSFKIAHRLMDDPTDGRETWKYPIKEYSTTDEKLASEIAETFNYYLGGSEFWVAEKYDSKLDADVPNYYVSSRGYYHYIGA